MLKPLNTTLLSWAKKKKLDPQSHLMLFLKILANEQLSIRDIDIRSKEELKQFIELMELSMKTLINNEYFFERDEQRLLSYIQRLKEIADDWDNVISDEWKNGKSEVKIIFPKNQIDHEPFNTSSKPTTKEFIKQSLLYFLMLIFMIGIILFLGSIGKYF